MDKRKVLKFLIKPPMWLCIVIWTVGAISLAGSITLYYVGLGLKEWAFAVHSVALAFFILSIYAVLTVIGIPERAKNSKRVKKMFSSYSTRAFVWAACSVVFNLCYVVFGIIISNLTHSLWLGVLVLYHVFLILPRFAVLYTAKMRGRGEGEDAQKYKLRAYAYCGLALILLAIAFAPVIKLTLEDQNVYNYKIGAMAYVCGIALYTFVKLGISIHNFRKAHKQSDMALIAVKNTSFADALISVFTLQAMMIKELNSAPTSFAARINPSVGAVIMVAIFALGLHMMISGFKRLKLLKAEVQDGGESIEADEPYSGEEIERND